MLTWGVVGGILCTIVDIQGHLLHVDDFNTFFIMHVLNNRVLRIKRY